MSNGIPELRRRKETDRHLSFGLYVIIIVIISIFGLEVCPGEIRAILIGILALVPDFHFTWEDGL